MDSAVHGEKRLHGNVATWDVACKEPSVGNAVEVIFGHGLDIAGGMACAGGLDAAVAGEAAAGTDVSASPAEFGASDASATPPDVPGCDAPDLAGEIDVQHDDSSAADGSGATHGEAKMGEDSIEVEDEANFRRRVISKVKGLRDGFRVPDDLKVGPPQRRHNQRCSVGECAASVGRHRCLMLSSRTACKIVS